MYKHPVIEARDNVIKRLRRQRLYRTLSRLGIKGGIAAGSGLALAIAGLVFWLQPAAATPPPTVLGELPYQQLLPHTLTDKAGLEVNAANGNVVLKTQDLTVAGAGPALSVGRYFNSLASGSGQAGSRDTLSVGADVSITANANGSATYQGPSGYQVVFPSNGSGGYITPAEFTGAKLSTVAGGGWTLKFNKDGEAYTFNAAGRQTGDKNAAGLGITYAYNTNGTLATATDAQGKITTFGSYSGSKVGLITDPSGRTIQYTYNTNGQLTDVTDTNGKTWHYEYWDGQHVTFIVDPRGYSTTLSYDTSGRVTTINYNDYTSAKTTWTYTYNAGNTVVTDPLIHTATYTYDGLGRVTDNQNGVGDHKGQTWDSNNNPTASSDSAGHSTAYGYDSLNNPTSKQNPNASGTVTGAKTTYDYTNALQPYLPNKKTDAAGNTVSYSYNTNGSLTTAASSSAGGTAMGTSTSKYQGDVISGVTVTCGAKAGQLCSTTDARGNTTTYGYDTNGNITTVTPPGPVSAKTYTYDSLSRVKTFTDGNGSKVTITYDNADRPTNFAYAADGSSIGYTYDAHGNLTQRSDAAGTTGYTYDGYNRVTKITQTAKADLNYTYDSAGNLKTEQGPFGTVTYSYDNANQVTRINQPGGNNQDFAYTDGKVTTAWLPGGIVETLTYDNAGRQTGIKAVKSGTTTLTDFSGTYMNATATKDTEYLQKETNNINTGGYAYSYDGMGRLTGAAGFNGASSFTYIYDATGNITQKSMNGTYSAIFGFNTANELTTAGGAANGTYDNAGNQTSNGTGLAMAYNAKEQTKSFTPSGGSAINATYLDNGQTGRTQFGNVQQKNGLLGLYSDNDGTTSTYYTHLPTGTQQITGQTIGSAYYYYLTDLRGSTIKMTDASGNVINTYDYDPYGKTISSIGSTANTIRYANGYYDISTNLYKYGARYYNPSDARWTQLDPSGQNFSYLYAGDNPVNFVDPSGLYSLSGFLATTLGTVGAIGLAATCPVTAGVGCAVAAGAFGGLYGAAIGSALGGGTADQNAENALNGGISGGLGGAPIGKITQLF